MSFIRGERESSEPTGTTSKQRFWIRVRGIQAGVPNKYVEAGIALFDEGYPVETVSRAIATVYEQDLREGGG